MKRLVRLFPAAWRSRYGAEFEALLDNVPATPSGVADVVSAAAGAHIRELDHSLTTPSGGPAMGFTSGPSRRAAALGWLGLLLSLPTAVILGAHFLQYGLGIPGAADAVDSLFVGRIAGRLFIYLPLVAAAIAALPVVGVRLARGEAGLQGSLVVHFRAINTAAVILGAGLGLFLIGHILTDPA